MNTGKTEKDLERIDELQKIFEEIHFEDDNTIYWQLILLMFQLDIDNFEFIKDLINIEHSNYKCLIDVMSDLAWTPIPSKGIGTYDMFDLENKKEKCIDEILSSHCDSEDLKSLFYDLLDTNSLLAEAFYSYENEKYFSCATVLFTLIERALYDKNNWSERVRPNSNEIIEKIKGNKNFNNLIQYNIYKVISNLFRKASKVNGDYNKKFKCINRNFILHGQVDKQSYSQAVSKIDCFKLFILLYNIIEVL